MKLEAAGSLLFGFLKGRFQCILNQNSVLWVAVEMKIITVFKNGLSKYTGDFRNANIKVPNKTRKISVYLFLILFPSACAGHHCQVGF